jgi:hypothetical protein
LQSFKRNHWHRRMQFYWKYCCKSSKWHIVISFFLYWHAFASALVHAVTLDAINHKCSSFYLKRSLKLLLSSGLYGRLLFWKGSCESQWMQFYQEYGGEINKFNLSFHFILKFSHSFIFPVTIYKKNVTIYRYRSQT